MTATTASASLLPPPDPRLPRLHAALSDDAAAILDDALARSGCEITACRISYLRYKPQQSCLILYRVEVRDDRGRVRDHLVHIRLYARDRCERVWARGRVQALAARLDATGPLRLAARLPSLDAIAQVFPVDVDLPALERFAVGELVRYKPGRKALIKRGDTFVKLYADDRGARAFAAGRALSAAGAPVAEPAAYDAPLRALVHPVLPGIPLSSLRASSGYNAAAGEAGAALARLHATAVESLVPHDYERELDAAATAVGVARPDLCSTATRLVERVRAVLDCSRRPPSTIHGDFYDDQVLIGAAGLVLVDLDRVAYGDSRLDLGNFVAHLSASGEEPDASERFLDSYAAASGASLDRRGIAAAEAAGLLKLATAPFRVLDPRWPEEVERRLELAAARLEDARRTVSVSVPRDPALPQLGELLDPPRAQGVLSEILGRRVHVVGAELVRHRAGRRATLRYELPSETVYAKAYASDRAARVHRRLASLAAARVHGLATPQPLGMSNALHLVVTGEVRGAAAGPQLLRGDVDLAERIAVRLNALHSSDAQLEWRHGPDDEFAAVERRICKLPLPLRTDAMRCLARSAIEIARPSWRSRPVHRDFYPDQVVVEGRRVAFLDVDDAAMSEPAVDVANFLAHLRLMAIEQGWAVEPLGVVAEAFGRRACLSDADLDASLVRTLEAMTLVRLACIHLAKGRTLAARVLASAEAVASGADRWP